MRRKFGYALSVAGLLVFVVAVIGGGYSIVEQLIDPTDRPKALIFLRAAVAVLSAAFGVALLIIGKDLSGLPAFVFPRVRAFVTSGPTVVAAMIGAVALWCMSAWFTMYIAKLLMTKPYGELTFNVFLGIPFGILIPLAAGFALFAVSRIPPVPAPPEAPPPPDPVRMLGNTFAVFGLLWFLFAGSSSWTSGFNPSGATNGGPELLHNAELSLVIGALFAVVGLWLRRIALASALS